MMHDLMSREDLDCLREFMDAGNGEAIYECVEENPGVAGDAHRAQSRAQGIEARRGQVAVVTGIRITINE